MAVFTTVDDPSAYFKVQLFTGTGSSNAVSFNDTDTDMQPDMVWIKHRGATYNHVLTDVTRGVTEELYPNTDDNDVTNANGLTAFGSDGFTVGSDAGYNASSGAIVAWCWNTQGGAGSSNTDGSINTTTTSVNTTSKFSISTYTGTGSNATVGHGIGVKPDCIIVKRTDDDSRWQVYASTFGATKNLQLDDASALNDDATRWQDTEPTTTVFSLGTNGRVNESSGTFVAYAWNAVQGYSKFGKFTGNGNADGAFVYTGFSPAFLMVKLTSGAGQNWFMFDNKRSPFNINTKNLYADESGAEGTADRNDFLSNGFKFRESGAGENGSDKTYIYMAFAEAPFVNSEGVPGNAR